MEILIQKRFDEHENLGLRTPRDTTSINNKADKAFEDFKKLNPPEDTFYSENRFGIALYETHFKTLQELARWSNLMNKNDNLPELRLAYFKIFMRNTKRISTEIIEKFYGSEAIKNSDFQIIGNLSNLV